MLVTLPARRSGRAAITRVRATGGAAGAPGDRRPATAEADAVAGRGVRHAGGRPTSLVRLRSDERRATDVADAEPDIHTTAGKLADL